MAIKDNNITNNGFKNGNPDPLWVRRYPATEDSSELTIAAKPFRYSASEIARAVEDCDAHLLNLNVTKERTDDGDLVVDIRVNCKNGDSVARSLMRYGYEIMNLTTPDYDDEEDDSQRNRALEILRILEI